MSYCMHVFNENIKNASLPKNLNEFVIPTIRIGL